MNDFQQRVAVLEAALADAERERQQLYAALRGILVPDAPVSSWEMAAVVLDLIDSGAQRLARPRPLGDDSE